MLAAVTFAVSLASSLISFEVGQRILAGKHLDVSFSDPGVARAVIGGALYLTVSALLGLAIASILRHTAAAIGTLLGVLLVLPSLVRFLPGSLAHTVGRYLPSGAGSAVIKTQPRLVGHGSVDRLRTVSPATPSPRWSSARSCFAVATSERP